MLLNFDDVRVATGGTRLLGRSRDISSDGFRLREFGKGITSPAQEHLVPWAQIESIQVRRSASGVGPLAGAAIGFAIGFTIHVAQVPAAIFSFGETKPNGTPILVGVVGGAALGALLNRAGPWHTVYP